MESGLKKKTKSSNLDTEYSEHKSDSYRSSDVPVRTDADLLSAQRTVSLGFLQEEPLACFSIRSADLLCVHSCN